jgi:membrane associated rhomboid family serine protease
MNDTKETSHAAIYSLLLTIIPWILHLTGALFSLNLQRFGLSPLNPTGLSGILTLPFLHGSWDHLMSNTPSLFLLMFGLFLFYKKDARSILFYLYLISGLLTWFMGRPGSLHIGASGLVYALAAFHFVSGIIKKVPQQLAFALLVAFLYGGFVWAFFPALYQHTSISWEGHLSGLLAGIALAFYFRRLGPKPPVYSFMEEEEEEEEDLTNAYRNMPEQEKEKK